MIPSIIDEGGSFLDRYLMVMLGGAGGSLTRYLVGIAIMQRAGGRFPLGTVLINITGSFLIGFLTTILTERLNPHPNWRLILVVGFLGGYTTFSSFEWETFGLVRDGARWLGLLNVIGSVGIGYVAVWLGAILAGRR
jgi:fluoride exporter